MLFNLISIISFYKIQVVEKPFLPEDIMLIGNAFEIANYGNLKIEPILLFQIFLTISFCKQPVKSCQKMGLHIFADRL